METKYRVARRPEDSNFCYFPFFEILMTAEGKFKPCSKHGEFITNEGEVLTVDNSSIEEAWNSDYMVNLRENFHNNIKSHGCRECWRQQEMGLKEMRYDSYSYPCPESQVENPEHPMRVEVNASNVCNLRCRICMPTASHKWIPEAKALYGWEEKVHFNMTPENTETIRKWVPNMIEIGFFGGEPLSAEENIDLIRYCVETGHSKHIDILVNTNGTVYSDEIVGLFKEFKHVFLNFSIDDIGERFEYQRKGAKWDNVVSNIKKYLKHGGYTSEDTIEIKFCCSVTNMNIYYFPEYFAYMNEHFPGLAVFWNLIYEPWEYSIEILPEEIKDIIRDRLRNFVKTTYEMSESRTKTIENLVTFLDNSINRDFSKFFLKVAWHDRYRNEDFAEVFPEFWALIEKYKPESLAPNPSLEAARNAKNSSNADIHTAFTSRLAEMKADLEKQPLNKYIAERDIAEIFDELRGIFDAAITHFSFDPQSEKAKHDMLEGLFNKPEFERDRFVNDIITHGITRIVHYINQNDLGDLESIISDQYMSGFSTNRIKPEPVNV